MYEKEVADFGLLDKEEMKLFNQILFHTDYALNYCKYVKVEKVM